MAGYGDYRLGSFLITVDSLIGQCQWANKETTLKTLSENWFFGLATQYFGVLKRWTGSVWAKTKLKVFVSGEWLQKPLKRWDGSEWKEIETTGG